MTANSYLHLMPKAEYAPELRNANTLSDVCTALKAISHERLLRCGRVYGGGLYKLEPSELMSVPADELADVMLPLTAVPTLF